MTFHSTISPALVTGQGARRAPRLPLLALCGAWLLPGILGRDPWRSADLLAYGVMQAMADGRTSWLRPALGGIAADAAPLPHWLGAGAIALLGPLTGGPLAARLAFALLMAMTLALTWYATFHLGRTQAAQPVTLALGGDPVPVDYARAIADGALLAMLATLGLLQLGHETTPELAQLAGTALLMWALAASPFRRARARVAIVAAPVVLSLSNAPYLSLAFSAWGAWLCARSSYDQARAFTPWVLAGAAAGAVAATASGAWSHRLGDVFEPADTLPILRQWLWFLWPVWPLALWTLWRWRGRINSRHVSIPAGLAAAAAVTSAALGGSDRALLLAVPPLAVLAAFALPTFKRSASALIDWFSIFFFTVCALLLWGFLLAVHTGWPAVGARNVARLIPDFHGGPNALEIIVAAVATLGWLALVRWRTGRHRPALWKALVLPAGGVALSWVLLMTLWLPAVDHARSARVWTERIRALVGTEPGCIAAPRASAVTVAALEIHGPWTVRADAGAMAPDASAGRCRHAIVEARANVAVATPVGWTLRGTVRRPADRSELTRVYTRP